MEIYQKASQEQNSKKDDNIVDADVVDEDEK